MLQCVLGFIAILTTMDVNLIYIPKIQNPTTTYKSTNKDFNPQVRLHRTWSFAVLVHISILIWGNRHDLKFGLFFIYAKID